MGWLVFDKHPGGGSGEVSIGNVGKAVEIYTIVMDGPDYSTEAIRGLFPEVYTTFHALNPLLRLQPLEIDQSADAPELFTVTVTWSAEKLDPKDKDEKEDDPLNRKARVAVKTGRETQTKHRDIRGVPKVNAAGDLFDPPLQSNTSHIVITIRKNVTVFPDWMFEYSDCVNSLPFQIKGRTINKGCAWIAEITLGEENSDGPVAYCEATIEMHVRRKRLPTAHEAEQMTANPELDLVPGPWWTEQLNEGYFAKVGGVRERIKVKDQDSSAMVPASSPVPLTALGAALSPVTLDTLTYVVFQDHEEKDFNLISYLWSNA